MLKAGFARLDVTPPLGTFVPGAGFLRLSEKVLDPIYLNALAISLDGETVIIVAADFIGIKMSHIEDLRELIASRTGVPAENVMIHALHQHSAIALDSASKMNNLHKDYHFLDVLYRTEQRGFLVFQRRFTDTVDALIGIHFYKDPVCAEAVHNKGFDVNYFHFVLLLFRVI